MAEPFFTPMPAVACLPTIRRTILAEVHFSQTSPIAPCSKTTLLILVAARLGETAAVVYTQITWPGRLVAGYIQTLRSTA